MSIALTHAFNCPAECFHCLSEIALAGLSRVFHHFCSFVPMTPASLSLPVSSFTRVPGLGVDSSGTLSWKSLGGFN